MRMRALIWTGMAIVAGLLPVQALAQANGQPNSSAQAPDQTKPPIVLTAEERKSVDDALAGQPQAQSDVGMMFFSGRGLPQNDAQALNWFRMAAANGNADGQYNLAMMYEKGRGVAPDDARAQKLLTQAALQGQSEAQLMLGLIETVGSTTRAPDDALSMAWLEVSAKNGNESASAALDMMTPTVSDEVQADAAQMAAVLGAGLGVDQAQALNHFRRDLAKDTPAPAETPSPDDQTPKP